MDEQVRSFRGALPLVLLTGLLVGQTNSALADANGRAGDSGATAGRDCGRCHSLANGATTVAFGGVPASVVANSVNTFTFTVSGGPAQNAGLGVRATGGTLGVTGTGTKILSTEVVHSSPTAPFTNGRVVYTFTWTAPATAGTVTLFGAGVSGDNTGSESADGADATSVAITVTAGTAVNVAPTALITGPATGVVGIPVSFDGSGSTDPDGTIATYAWDFGDNSAGAAAKPPAHSYAAPGTYPVTLTVTDNLGLTGTATQNIVISAVGAHVAPVANAGGPYTGTAGTAVAFDGSNSTVSSGLTGFYTWDFGDNSVIATISMVKPSHVYSAAGTYLVKLTLVDSGTPPLSSTVTTTAVISAATTPPGSTGQQLYDANCASCHGPKGGPAGPDGSVDGESAGDIREAIQEEPAMQSLSTLTSSEIFSIAVYLKRTARVSRGEKLFNQYCASCHGPGGNGGDEPAIVGASEKSIKGAIRSEPEMATLKPLLKKEDAIEAIAKFLGGPHDDIMAKGDTTETDDTFLNSNSESAAGALDWLTLMGVGAWGFSRRRKK